MTDKKDSTNCPFHDEPYDGSRRMDDGTEMRWRSGIDGNSKTKGILPCNCELQYKPETEDK